MKTHLCELVIENHSFRGILSFVYAITVKRKKIDLFGVAVFSVLELDVWFNFLFIID